MSLNSAHFLTFSFAFLSTSLLSCVGLTSTAIAGIQVDASLLQFCSQTSRQLQEAAARQSSSSSSGSLGVSIPIKGILVGGNASMSDQSSSSSMRSKVDEYNSRNCDAVLKAVGDAYSADKAVEAAKILAQSSITREIIRSNAFVRDSNNRLDGIKDTNSSNLEGIKDTNRTSLSIEKERARAARNISSQENSSNMIISGVSALGGLLGGIFNNSARNQERALELQAQRERLEYEARHAQSPVYSQSVQAAQATQPYLNAVNQQLAGSQVVDPAVILRSFGLAHDPGCSSNGVKIQLQLGQLLCAFPSASYSAGMYMLSGGQLVPMR